MVGNVDLESDNQAGLAQEVLEAMLLGAPTTTPDIPTRTRDPDLTLGNLKKKKIMYIRALFYFLLRFDNLVFFFKKDPNLTQGNLKRFCALFHFIPRFDDFLSLK